MRKMDVERIRWQRFGFDAGKWRLKQTKSPGTDRDRILLVAESKRWSSEAAAVVWKQCVAHVDTDHAEKSSLPLMLTSGQCSG